MSKPVHISLENLVNALLDVDRPLLPKYLYQLSDLSPGDVAVIEQRWSKIPSWRRQAIMEDIERLGESDSLLSFEALSRFALKDDDPRVREVAVRSLWEYENPILVDTFLNMMEHDVASEVRAAAALALGKYVYLGEIEEIPETTLHRIEDRLLSLSHSKEEQLVRRRILETLGFSSRDEINPLIEKAYRSGDENWIASSLFAMGRSANERWIPLVEKMFDNTSPTIRLEAVRAAGELEARNSVPLLMDLINDDDEEIRLAAIWSLSQIGGEGVRELLEKVYEESDDDEMYDFIESALDNLAFTEDLQLFSLIDLPGLDEEGMEDLEEDEYLEFEKDED